MALPLLNEPLHSPSLSDLVGGSVGDSCMGDDLWWATNLVGEVAVP